MVNRVFTDDDKELVELCRRFVCMKFCERDDRDEYYRAAGYFLPQWYWQPILGVCFPDGREMNVHWRRTHEAVPVADVKRILREALKLAGDGIDPAAAAKGRDAADRAEAALGVQDFDAAERLAAEALSLAPRGGARSDAGKTARRAKSLRGVKGRLDRLQAAEDAPAAAGDLASAMILALAGDPAGALEILDGLGGEPAGLEQEARDLRAAIGEILRDSVEVLRVSHERFRHGSSLFHEIRCELRAPAGFPERLDVQYSVRLGDGRVYAAWERYAKPESGRRLRASVLLPAAEAVDPGILADLRAEAFLRGERVGARHLLQGDPAAPWWNAQELRPLFHHGEGGGWWATPGLKRTGERGVRLAPEARVLELAPPPACAGELQAVFEDLDGNRFRASSQAAMYRLVALGPSAVPAWAPLAHRYGGYTTMQLVSTLARVPGEAAAGALLHVIGADDVTIKYPAFQLCRWLEGRDDVPIGEVVGYVESGPGDLPDLGARALGLIGRKEGFLPLLGHLRRLSAGTARAEHAVAAIADLTGRDFGLDPSRPLAEQGEAVKRIAEWWKAGAEKEPRAVWMAQALEEAGFAAGGALAAACRAGEGAEASPAVAKALASGKPRAVRCALLIAKDLKIKALAPAVLDLFLRMDARDANLGLARNVLRDCMDAELLGKLIEGLKEPGKTDVLVDFLLVVTGKHEFYPETGPRMGKAEREAYGKKWADWLAANRERLRYDPAEGRFVETK
ncbi:MAG: hypothetical protein MUC63_02980 [Planctomycetes bacterium]|nr:hypothetical protein [Planctomycetota bacterium]